MLQAQHRLKAVAFNGEAAVNGKIHRSRMIIPYLSDECGSPQTGAPKRCMAQQQSTNPAITPVLRNYKCIAQIARLCPRCSP
ncbi:hypothetical protein D3C80_1828810 [compost metagenome]